MTRRCRSILLHKGVYDDQRQSKDVITLFAQDSSDRLDTLWSILGPHQQTSLTPEQEGGMGSTDNEFVHQLQRGGKLQFFLKVGNTAQRGINVNRVE